MAEAGARPWAVVVLVTADHDVPVAALDPTTDCDLALVEDLLRLRLAAARLGWSVRLAEVDDALRELVVLLGAEELLLPGDQGEGASITMGRPNSGNSSG
jgi:hypothetical protein